MLKNSWLRPGSVIRYGRGKAMRLFDDIEKLNAYLAGSPWMANLTAALESKTTVALVVGTVDNVSLIRDMFGHISFDHVFPAIGKILHEQFGDYSVWWGAVFPYFLILLTGDEAKNAAAVAESIRANVEGTAFDERFYVTMHFGLTEPSSSWTMAGRLRGLLNAADTAIDFGKRRVVSNRVYEPANLQSYREAVEKKR
jgi:GGDEF domain-containing protein